MKQQFFRATLVVFCAVVFSANALSSAAWGQAAPDAASALAAETLEQQLGCDRERIPSTKGRGIFSIVHGQLFGGATIMAGAIGVCLGLFLAGSIAARGTQGEENSVCWVEPAGPFAGVRSSTQPTQKNVHTTSPYKGETQHPGATFQLRTVEFVVSQKTLDFETRPEKIRRQGARIRRNKRTCLYAAMIEDEAQRNIRTLYECVMF